jgi:hypothetical protein
MRFFAFNIAVVAALSTLYLYETKIFDTASSSNVTAPVSAQSNKPALKADSTKVTQEQVPVVGDQSPAKPKTPVKTEEKKSEVAVASGEKDSVENKSAVEPPAVPQDTRADKKPAPITETKHVAARALKAVNYEDTQPLGSSRQAGNGVNSTEQHTSAKIADAPKEIQKFMSPKERRRELHKLANSLENMFLNTLPN